MRGLLALPLRDLTRPPIREVHTALLRGIIVSEAKE